MPIEIDRKKMLARLDEWGEKSGELKEQLALYKGFLAIGIDFLSQAGIPKPAMEGNEAAKLQAQGYPLLSSRNLPIDWQQAIRLFY